MSRQPSSHFANYGSSNRHSLNWNYGSGINQQIPDTQVNIHNNQQHMNLDALDGDDLSVSEVTLSNHELESLMLHNDLYLSRHPMIAEEFADKYSSE